MDKVRQITLKKNNIKKYPIAVGDTAKVSIKVREGNKERVQVFEGVILKIQGKDFDPSFTVRKISNGVGVEKTIPLASPNLSNVEIVSKSKVRRSRLYYLRNLKGRAARLNTLAAERTSTKATAKNAKKEDASTASKQEAKTTN